MKAAFIQATGGPEVIQYGDLPEPKLVPGGVRIATRAVAVNPIDTYIRGGANYWPLPNPYIIGCDLAGEILEVGPGVTGLQPGMRVWCTNQGLQGRQGTFAEQVVVDAAWVYPMTDRVAFRDAAAVALVGVTAHLGLFREARLSAGESIFVMGGAGGVGSMVVQMAKIAGARVLTCAGSDEKVQRCLELGADLAFNYRAVDLGSAIAEATQGRGVDVFWETRREPNFDFAVAALAARGRMVLMAGRDARPVFPVGPFYVKGCRLHGFVMFAASAAEMEVCGRDISQWLDAGVLRGLIGVQLPLSEAREAHRLQEAATIQQTGELFGKIVLEPATN
jgi:NADPH2:quinone reductase